MSDDKACAFCKQPFRPRRQSSKYCSRACMYAGKPKPQKSPLVTWRTQKGYIEMRITEAGVTRQLKQHRFIMEQFLGRALLPDETVHHVNGVRDDNRVENLQLLSASDHSVVTNSSRKYKRGYTLDLTNEERAARSERFKMLHKIGKCMPPQTRAALRKARGE